MGEPTIEDYYVEDRTFPPSPEFAAAAHLSDRSHHDEAAADYEAFWARQARELLAWDEDFHTTLQWDLPYAEWFVGGKLNMSANCLDRHVAPVGQAPGCSGQHRAGQRAAPCARLDDGEAVGPIQSLPHLVHPAGQHGTEQRPHLGARDEVAPTACHPARGVEACRGVVEARLHELVESERPRGTDEARQPGGEVGLRTADVSPRGRAG